MRWAWLPILFLSTLLPGSRIAPSAAPGPARPVVDVVVIAAQYLVITQAFENRTSKPATELRTDVTLNGRRSAYAEAAAAEHEMDGELLRLPLFPTPLRTHWKNLLMVNRHVEELYLELSVAGSRGDMRGLEALLPSARAEQLAADNALRMDLLLPARNSASAV
jgi:hypothetical protein